MSRTTVIAEPGACHDGQLPIMLSMVHSAIAARADVFKPQFWSDADQLADRRRASPAYREIYRRYQMPFDWLATIHEACGDLIRLACTVYLPKDAEVVAPWVDFLKVSSFEAMDPELLTAVAMTGLPVVVSTGMCTDDDLAILRRRLDRSGVVYQLLHCVSAYPAPLADCHLGTIRSSRLHGFSDHTDPAYLVSGAIAVGAGAGIIEAHMRSHDTDPSNPDAPHAMFPQEFAMYVAQVRQADRMMGSLTQKHPQASEAAMIQYRVRGPQ